MTDLSLLHSTEFYQRRYQNFSTLVIYPILVLVIFLVGFSYVATKEIAITTAGELTPVSSSKGKNPISIKQEKAVQVTYYVDSSAYPTIKEGQKITFSLTDASGKKTILKGKVSQKSPIPQTQKGINYYKITARLILTDQQADQLTYGLQGKVSSILKKTTYFNDFTSRVFHKN